MHLSVDQPGLLHAVRLLGRVVPARATLPILKNLLTPRLRAVLEREGFRVAVLKADTVAPDRREEWVDARVREGVDVLLINPRLVTTGLDYEESETRTTGGISSAATWPLGWALLMGSGGGTTKTPCWTRTLRCRYQR